MFSRILSILLLIAGLAIFGFGNYMSYEVTQKEERIAEAEENEEGHRRPVLGPVRRGIRTEQSETAERKIGAAKEKIASSEVTAYWLRGSGMALFIVGFGCLIFSFTRNKRN